MKKKGKGEGNCGRHRDKNIEIDRYISKDR